MPRKFRTVTIFTSKKEGNLGKMLSHLQLVHLQLTKVKMFQILIVWSIFYKAHTFRKNSGIRHFKKKKITPKLCKIHFGWKKYLRIQKKKQEKIIEECAWAERPRWRRRLWRKALVSVAWRFCASLRMSLRQSSSSWSSPRRSIGSCLDADRKPVFFEKFGINFSRKILIKLRYEHEAVLEFRDHFSAWRKCARPNSVGLDLGVLPRWQIPAVNDEIVDKFVKLQLFEKNPKALSLKKIKLNKKNN